MKKPFLLIIITLLISCSNTDSGSSFGNSKLSLNTRMSPPEMMVMADTGIRSPSNSSNLIERKIQKNARTNIEVKNIDDTVSGVDKIVQKYQGEIISSNRGGADIGDPYANISFRVPVESLDDVLSEILKLASKVIQEEIYTNDVTEEFIDVEAKLLNMKSTESRFQDLLLKTTTVSEILEVETQLTRIRGEIDALEGRLKYLNQTTSTSRIDLNIQQESSMVGDTWKFSESLRSAVRNLTSFGKVFADFSINLLIFSPILLFVILIVFLSLEVIVYL